jgi:hypothetical protein
MAVGKDALLRMHAGAFNAHDPQTLRAHHHGGVRCVMDGCLVAEGVDAVQEALLREFPEEVVTRVMDLDGEPVIVEWGGLEGREEPRAVVRLESHNDRVSLIRIDHDPRQAKRLGRPYT